jgi:hypothetical protein
VRLLRREAARADEATASGTWGRGSGDDGVVCWGKAAAGCGLTGGRRIILMAYGIAAIRT